SGPQGSKGVTGPQGIKGETGQAGSAGITGATGSTGVAGPTGSTGVLKVTEVPGSLTVQATKEGEETVKCNSGEVVTGGGYSLSGEFEVLISEAVGADAWKIKVKAKTETTGKVQAVCAKIEP
ncbi:MAG TPA: hypothetical protein VKG38_07415, partial [Solirubrobacteraceae bacterium]|nr:hypothetical protein [Solirubrobacteraceae bacterium]